jgi:hypothetical protein
MLLKPLNLSLRLFCLLALLFPALALADVWMGNLKIQKIRWFGPTVGQATTE